jgi:hypothetical protein
VIHGLDANVYSPVTRCIRAVETQLDSSVAANALIEFAKVKFPHIAGMSGKSAKGLGKPRR